MKTVNRVPSKVNEFVDFAKAENCRDVYIFGADIAGKVVKKILDCFGVSVKGFIDNNRNKTDINLDGVYVCHAPDFVKSADRNSIVLIASTYISDIIRQLEDAGFYNWAPIVDFLSVFDEGKYRSLLTGELRRNHAGGEFTNDFDIFVLDNMRNSQLKYLDNTKLYIRSVDIVITEKCSLKCQDCSNLMQYYASPKNIGLDAVMGEIDRVTSSAGEINELRIIGGDPFMNKEFPQIVNYATTKENVNKVVIYTNATIAPNIQKIKEMSDSRKIFVFMTTYDELSPNADKLSKVLDEQNIQYNRQPAYGWTDCGHFAVHNRDENAQEDIFKNCCAKHFTTLTDNKLFRCPFAANLHRLQATPVFEDDFVELLDVNKLSQDEKNAYQNKLKKYLREIAYIKYCDYCNGRTYGDPEIVPGIQTKKPIPYLKILKGQG